MLPRAIARSRYLPLKSPHSSARPSLYHRASLSTTKDSPPKFTPNKPTTTPFQNPSFGAANFKELGGSRTVKFVVITFLTLIGTLETIFWTKAIWARFGPGTRDENEVDEK